MLIDHDGKLIEDVGWLWDHAENKNIIAHDYLIANYVCPSGKHWRVRNPDSSSPFRDSKSRSFSSKISIVDMSEISFSGRESDACNVRKTGPKLAIPDTPGKHYPLEFRRFIKEEHCRERQIPFKDHTQLFIELIDWVVDKKIPGDFVFDSYFTNARPLNHINSLDRAYVGDLKFNRWVEFQGKQMHAVEVAQSIQPEIRKPIEWHGKKQ